MAATDPFTSESRRFSIRLPRPLWIVLTIAVSSLPAAGADNPADDDGRVGVILAAQQVEPADRMVYRWVFNLGPDADAADKMLQTALQRKIAVIDRACGLTDAQKERLQLAAHGDNKYLLDRVDKMVTQLQLVKAEPDKVKEMSVEAQRLARAVGPGLAEAPVGNSVFIKSLETTLTAEQLDKYRPLKVVLRAGGQILPRRLGTEDGLSIDLSDSKVTDDDIPTLMQIPKMNTLVLANTNVTDAGLSHLERLTRLQSLMLQETAVTDAGLARLKGLAELQQLNLRKTQVTDAGLVHLKGLTRLKLVTLGTNVMDAGIAEMRQAIPAAKIFK